MNDRPTAPRRPTRAHALAPLLPLLLLATVAGCAAPASSGRARTTGDEPGSIVFGGLTRTYLLHVPVTRPAAGGEPLVLALHGHGGTAAGMASLTHLDSVADQGGFVVAYPQGVDRSWADGRGTPADDAGVDDVGFLLALVDRLVAEQRVDPRRVYVTGISNGGFMTERLACQRADRFAAAAADAASLPTGASYTCAPARPVPMLGITGTADPLVPYGGGRLGIDRGGVMPAPESAAEWARLDGCTGAPVAGSIPDQVDDGTHIATSRWSTCAHGAAVVLDTVEGGGHTWPGGLQYLPVAVIGRTSGQMDASQAIWSFFSAHPRA